MKEKHIRTSGSSEAKRPFTNNSAGEDCVSETFVRFDSKVKAKEYGLDLAGTARDHREKRCIVNALANVPRGARVLDLPCGNGRLLPLLKELGYKVTAADSSGYMVRKARHYAGPCGENRTDKTVNFQVANIFETPFPDNHFDAVVCNRLLHHFNKPQARQQTLKELARISSGPVVVSFFSKVAVDAVTSKLGDMVRGRHSTGRMPISYKDFEKEARECGLIVEKWIPSRPFVSKQWYAVLRHDSNVHIHSAKLYNIVDWTKLGRKISHAATVAAVILIGAFSSTNMRAIVDPHEYQVERIAKEYQDGNDEFYVSADDDLEDLRTNDNLSVIRDVEVVDDKITDDKSQLKDSFFLISEKDAAKLKKTPIWAQLSFIKIVYLKNEHFVLLSTEKTEKSIEVQKDKSPPQATLSQTPASFC